LHSHFAGLVNCVFLTTVSYFSGAQRRKRFTAILLSILRVNTLFRLYPHFPAPICNSEYSNDPIELGILQLIELGPRESVLQEAESCSVKGLTLVRGVTHLEGRLDPLWTIFPGLHVPFVDGDETTCLDHLHWQSTGNRMVSSRYSDETVTIISHTSVKFQRPVSSICRTKARSMSWISASRSQYHFSMAGGSNHNSWP
jgi:hypothetical protein